MKKALFIRGELSDEQKVRKKRFQAYFRIIAGVVIALVLVCSTYVVFSVLKDVGNDGWSKGVQERLSSYSGIQAFAVFIAIQAVQVLVAVIPPIQMVGGVLYGWFFGAVAAYAGIVIGCLLVWGIVKKFGTPLVHAIIGEKHIKKFGFLDDEKKLLIILIFLYIIPGIPKDTLTYIVPLTKIKMRDFFLYVLPWRIPAIMLSTAFGSNVTNGNYRIAIVFAILIVIIAILGVIFKDKILSGLNKRRERSKKHKKT